MSTFMDYLKQYEEAYQKAEVREQNNSFDELPDGKYKVQIDRVELTQSKSSGRPQMVWEFIVIEGKFKGRRIWKYNGLDSAEKIQWLKNDLWTAGLALERLTDLERNLSQLLDQFLEITLKTKGSVQGIYINKMLEMKDLPEPEIRKTENRAIENPKVWASDLTEDDLPF